MHWGAGCQAQGLQTLTLDAGDFLCRNHVALVVTCSVANEDSDGCNQARAHQPPDVPDEAEAEAIAINKITEAVGKSTNPASYLIAQKYIQMLSEMAQNNNQKTVFMPYEATNLMGSIGGIKEMFK